MKLIWKLSIPQVIFVLVLGIVSYMVIHSSFTDMKQRYVEDTVHNRFTRISTDINKTAEAATNLAAVFAKVPAVLDAYALAHSGNMDDENSPESQAAREMLRKALAPMLNSYKEISGESMQLHFHLPNGRSLARLWRKQQAKRNGKWVDISDDLSSFRQTVLDVNRTGQPVSGIELGRGGFVVRGLVPVKSPEGRQLGSVEMLFGFDPILSAATEEGKNEMIMYMNGDMLSITTALQDEAKFPRLGSFVRTTTPKDSGVEQYVTSELLERGKTGNTFDDHGELVLATYPIPDYRGKQIGVLVCAVHTGSLMQLVARADTTLMIMLAGMALAPVLVLLVFLRHLVTKPLTNIKAKIKDIAEDKADLTEQIHCTQKDEIGDLARWFNTLTTKLSSMIDEMEGYVNVLNTVPDPIFVVDEEYRILMANKATLDFLGMEEKDLTKCRCHDQFKTSVCSTPDCPINMVKQLGRRAEADIIELKQPDGNSVFIKPSANLLKDSKGHKVGYVEVARVVTDLVHAEREMNVKLERIRQVNEATREAAVHLSSTSSDLAREFSGVQQALDNQQNRLQETVTAMEQMNVTVQQVAQSATEAAEQSQSAREQAQQGAAIVDQSVSAILRVSEQASAMKVSMHQLGKQAQEIGAVLGVISDIADQTNLLALNAAIEAARAGEAGRGFAVVADEVRKLAEKTMQATSEVEKAIGSIQRGAQDSIRMVDETGGLVEDASTLATRSGEALQSIVQLVTASSDQVHNIATAAEEQSATSDHINGAIDEVANMASDVSSRMDASTGSVQELAALARELDNLSKG
ncbi:MAG: methyl-accepting chemotaxis protein [Halodesulfovibrio sp.]